MIGNQTLRSLTRSSGASPAARLAPWVCPRRRRRHGRGRHASSRRGGSWCSWVCSCSWSCVTLLGMVGSRLGELREVLRRDRAIGEGRVRRELVELAGGRRRGHVARPAGMAVDGLLRRRRVVAGDPVRGVLAGRHDGGARRDRREPGVVGPAHVEPPRAAGRERAAGRGVAHVRRPALDRDQRLALAIVDPGHRVQEAHRVRVRRRLEQVAGRRGLDDEPGVHDVDPVGHPGDHAQVVGDEDERRAGLGREAGDELQDLGLDRHVEGGRGLVRDHQLRLEGQRHRDHHALAHAARELVREALEPGLRLRDADHAQQLRRPRPGLGLGHLPVGDDRLGHLLLDREHRVEARHRVLEDHRDVAAADLAHVRLVHRHEVDAVEQHRAALDVPGGLRQQADDREVGDALAAARLAHEAEALAAGELERDAVDGVDRPVVGPELDDEVVDVEQDVRGARALAAVGSASVPVIA